MKAILAYQPGWSRPKLELPYINGADRAGEIVKLGAGTAGKLNPSIDSSFPLRKTAAAQERLWCDKNSGKITLDIS
ncbi:hypothetical protein ANAEL_03285 [Anaerolineales bacterium]|nr:hypothetical protein ANAEL_03285 [Anaerolineales bacterium]